MQIFRAVDNVLATAAKYDLRVIVVFISNWQQVMKPLRMLARLPHSNKPQSHTCARVEGRCY